jgi:hypothetical protein
MVGPAWSRSQVLAPVPGLGGGLPRFSREGFESDDGFGVQPPTGAPAAFAVLLVPLPRVNTGARKPATKAATRGLQALTA